MTHYCPTCGQGYDGELPSRCPEDGALLLAIETTGDRYVGHLIAGRFRLVQMLGRGGAGTVYRAIQQPIGRTVAVKLMARTNIEEDETRYRRFVRESKLASSLHHPNIVSPVDFGVDRELNAVYFAMEYIEGIDLEKIIVEHRLDLPLALEILHQTCSALTEAHDKGVIHRDLKPGNIRLAVLSDGALQIKVLDLGIARPLDEEESITREDNITGTMAYIPPEYIVTGDLGSYSDLYSLGVLLFELLSGRKPFYGNRLQLIFHHISTAPPELNDVLPDDQKMPDAINDLVSSMLEKKPADRPQTAQQVQDQVDAIRADLGIKSFKIPPTNDAISVETFTPWLKSTEDLLEHVQCIPDDLVANLKEFGAEVITSDSSPGGARVNLATPPPLPGTLTKSKEDDSPDEEESAPKKPGLNLPTPGQDAGEQQSKKKKENKLDLPAFPNPPKKAASSKPSKKGSPSALLKLKKKSRDANDDEANEADEPPTTAKTAKAPPALPGPNTGKAGDGQDNNKESPATQASDDDSSDASKTSSDGADELSDAPSDTTDEPDDSGLDKTPEDDTSDTGEPEDEPDASGETEAPDQDGLDDEQAGAIDEDPDDLSDDEADDPDGDLDESDHDESLKALGSTDEPEDLDWPEEFNSPGLGRRKIPFAIAGLLVGVLVVSLAFTLISGGDDDVGVSSDAAHAQSDENSDEESTSDEGPDAPEPGTEELASETNEDEENLEFEEDLGDLFDDTDDLDDFDEALAADDEASQAETDAVQPAPRQPRRASATEQQVEEEEASEEEEIDEFQRLLEQAGSL